jgi:hypothetical protein
MAKIVNLRTTRKRTERAGKERQAQQNRFAHGRTKAELELEKARTEQAAHKLDAHRREGGQTE